MTRGSIAVEQKNLIMQERRSDVRAPVNTTGAIKFGAAGNTLPCTIIDLTRQGAGLTVTSTFGIPKTFQLTIKGEKQTRYCRVIWAQGSQLGVSFD
jgi:PilZ domain